MTKIKRSIRLLAIGLTMGLVFSSCSLTLPVTATSNPVGAKVGTSKATGFLSVLFFNADASIMAAAKQGGITEISTVDLKYKNLLGLVVTYETIVTGN